MPQIFLVLEDGQPNCAFYRKASAYGFIASVIGDTGNKNRAYCVKSVDLFEGDQTPLADNSRGSCVGRWPVKSGFKK